MFDLSSSKLLILGLVALIVVGPKELPLLLRTLGKYMAMIRRQAAEFRSQFDEAMRESELDTLKKDIENVGSDMQKTMRDAEMSVEKEVAAANAEMDAALKPAEPVIPPLEIPAPDFKIDPMHGLNGLDPTPPPVVSAPAVTTVAEPVKAGP
jgi:sec-independent protein translocase protein TatB